MSLLSFEGRRETQRYVGRGTGRGTGPPGLPRQSPPASVVPAHRSPDLSPGPVSYALSEPVLVSIDVGEITFAEPGHVPHRAPHTHKYVYRPGRAGVGSKYVTVRL